MVGAVVVFAVLVLGTAALTLTKSKPEASTVRSGGNPQTAHSTDNPQTAASTDSPASYASELRSRGNAIPGNGGGAVR